MQVFSAWCLGCRPGAAKWRSQGRKIARLGFPGIPKGAEGARNASQNAPKNRPKISILSRTASKGAPGVPWVPSRPQNTPIFVDQLSQTAARDNRFTDILLHSTHFLALKSIAFFGGSRASGALSRCMCALLPEPGYSVALSVCHLLRGVWHVTALTQSRSRSPTASVMEDCVLED